MSLLNKKLLVNGCGLSYSHQQKKTWVNLLNSIGASITDISGPAVSNQWIIDRTFVHLMNNSNYDWVILQLTAIGKLDVLVTDDRIKELVETDSLRNFVVDKIWPSSASQEHVSKQMYYKYLHSPDLEIQELFCKIMMFSSWCKTNNINLLILQGYEVDWTEYQAQALDLGKHPFTPLYTNYLQSKHYQQHDHANHNTVPCLEYYIDLAKNIAGIVYPELLPRLNKLESHLTRSVDQK